MECHWSVVFEENYGGVNDKKALIHINRCDVYMNENKSLLRVGIWWKLLVVTGRRFFEKW